MNDAERRLYRAVLAAIDELRAFSRREATGAGSTASVMNSTTALISLLEGWCVDHAIRWRDPAISTLTDSEQNDTDVLDALRHFYCAS